MQELEGLRSEVESFEKLELELNDVEEICEIVSSDEEWDDIEKQVVQLQKNIEKI